MTGLNVPDGRVADGLVGAVVTAGVVGTGATVDVSTDESAVDGVARVVDAAGAGVAAAVAGAVVADGAELLLHAQRTTAEAPKITGANRRLIAAAVTANRRAPARWQR